MENLCDIHSQRRAILSQTLVFAALTTCVSVFVVYVLQYFITGTLLFQKPAPFDDDSPIKKELKYWLRGEVARRMAEMDQKRHRETENSKPPQISSLRNFAAASAGASVVKSSGTYLGDQASRYLLLFPVYTPAPSPVTALQPYRDVGDCWSMIGSHGHLLIHLAANTFIEAFTVEHITAQLHLGGVATEAPRNFSVYGVDSNSKDSGRHLFGVYSYDIEGPSAQMFPVMQPAHRSFWLVDFVIGSNHGHKSKTCIYRFQVHGKMDERVCTL